MSQGFPVCIFVPQVLTYSFKAVIHAAPNHLPRDADFHHTWHQPPLYDCPAVYVTESLLMDAFKNDIISIILPVYLLGDLK